ncbi:hypothetical protein KKB83_04885, partial [Patescibacteria group bacterium]|nr:hypothetical protein [Patescibacteria group bacterium]
MILSKRQKTTISTFTLALTLALSNKSVPFLGGVAWLLPVIVAIWLTFWALDFEFKLCEYLIFALYPALLGVNSFLVLNQILNQAGQGRGWLDLVLLLGFSLISVSIFYMLLSALNILNVATVRTVPLKKAALLILMLIGLILGTSSFYQIAGPLGL